MARWKVGKSRRVRIDAVAVVLVDVNNTGASMRENRGVERHD